MAGNEMRGVVYEPAPQGPEDHRYLDALDPDQIIADVSRAIEATKSHDVQTTKATIIAETN